MMIYDCPACSYPLERSFVLCPMCGAALELGPQGFVQRGWMCFACGRENPNSRDRACLSCGERYSIECPNCGAEAEPKSSFCPECGFDFGADRQRARDAYERGAREPIRPPSIGVSLAILLAGLALAAAAVFVAPERLFAELLAIASAVVFAALFAIATHLPFLSRKPKRLGRYQEVYSSLNPMLAEHVRAILELEGIEAFIYNRYGVALAPFDPKGARVMVPKDKVDAAEGILKDFGLL